MHKNQKGGTKLTKLQRAEVRSIIAELDRKGYNQTMIRDELKAHHSISLSQAMISKYMKLISNEYLRRVDNCKQSQIGRKLAQLGDRQRELLAEWDISRGMLTTDLARQVVDKVKTLIDNNLPVPDEFVVCLQAEPAYAAIRLVLECYREECELLGLYPGKGSVSNTNVNVGVGVGVMNIEQLQQSYKQQAMLEAKTLVEVKHVEEVKQSSINSDCKDNRNGSTHE
jgi:hypothetical protein